MKQFAGTWLLFLSFLLLFVSSCSRNHIVDEPGWHDEIIYHVMPRSFFDSNGDLHGDLNGFKGKLGYLKELGVTAILFTPLYESDFYHNYFPTDYESIDPEYGSMDEYISFIEAVHAHGLKFLMDMETQYAQNGNKWFDESYDNPASLYSDFIYYRDSLSHYPDQFYLQPYTELTTLKAWPDQQLYIVYLDLNHSKVKSYMKDFYTFWVDPNGDGEFNDGVDGFRIDHIMDDLDYKGLFTNMYTEFWRPVFDKCYSVNPDLFIVGEQSNWNEYGENLISETGASACFGFPIRFAIAGAPVINMGGGEKQYNSMELNAMNIRREVEATIDRIPDYGHFITFIENHDMDRWASAMEGHEGKIRAAAALIMLLPGIPSIYYGQELVVSGEVGDWGYDVNHIPIREAFPWTPDDDYPGTAVFYKGSGPWWEQSYFHTGETETTALSVQKPDPNSLWNFYREMIAIRRENRVFTSGDYQSLTLSDPDLFCFLRQTGQDRAVVIMNLSGGPKSLDLDSLNLKGYKVLCGQSPQKKETIILEAYEFSVLAN